MAATPYQCLACQAIFRNHRHECPFDGSPLVIIDEDALCGKLLADRYLIEECMGEGGMGRVYYAQHAPMNRNVAIRVLFGDYAADPNMCERFFREAETASRLSHPNVVSVIDFGKTAQNHLYLVTNYVEGRMLDQVIATKAPLDGAAVRRILRQLCLGLAHAHDQGLIHHDFKSQNILFTGCLDTGIARIADFGIALWSDASPERVLAGEGIVTGTPAFMSPEQAAGEPIDHRSDLYRLGIVLYQMLSGVLPFHGPALELAQKHMREVPPTIREQVPDLEVDPHLEAIALKLLAKQPEQRFQHASEVLAALDAAEHKDACEAEAALPNIGGTQAALPNASEPQAAIPEYNVPCSPDLQVPLPLAQAVLSPAIEQQTAAAAKEPGESLHWEPTGISVAASAATAIVFFLIAGSMLPMYMPFSRGEDARDSTSALATASPMASANEDPAFPEAAYARTGESNSASQITKNTEHDPRDESDDAHVGNRDMLTAGARELSFEAVCALYKDVGKELLRLTDHRGVKATEPYLSKYVAISLDDAARSRPLRQAAYKQLRALKRQVSRAIRIAKAN